MKIVKSRITSIDLLRGVVMVLMALDHVRDYFHYDAYFFDPTDLTQSNPAIFWTRFVTHFCAPVFIFLAGTSAFFIGQRRDKNSLSGWLLKRGIWLIFVELTIIKLAWNFKLDYSTTLLQVIWILGVAMIFLAGFIHLPRKLTIALSILAILGHNLLDGISAANTFSPALWSFLHQFNLVSLGSINVFIGYPMIPWIFVMPLGYYFGELYLPTFDPQLRVKRLWQIGLGMTVLFIVLKFVNIYGDPYFWSAQESLGLTIMSFFNITKYPPSLMYLLITLGPAIIFLAIAENWNGAFSSKLITIGQVPMFYYIIHIYVIHAFAVVAALLTGFTFSDMIIDVWVTMQPNLQGYGFNLGVVYLLWIILVVGLYPICKWYKHYKQANRDKWWLSYL